MKFSWQLTNSFLKIQKESFQRVVEALIISGIEVDNIRNTNKDKILELSITSNRKEINSAFSLAREISTVANTILTIQPIKLNINKQIIKNDFNCLKYRRVHTLYENKHIETPQWILEKLKINGNYHNNYLDNVKEYIYLKWGATFTITTSKENQQTNFTKKTENDNQLINYIIDQHFKHNKTKNLTLIIFDTCKTMDNTISGNYDNNEFYENYYTDSINIIKELNQCTIGKYYESYENILLQNKEIILEKSTLNKWLGNYKSTKDKFLPTKNIKKTLSNLKFFTKYTKSKRLFLVRIPPYRRHDIDNQIDIIEEIGKLNGFKNFCNTYKYKKQKGISSKEFIRVNIIRNVLRKLGFNEVVNCSIIHNTLPTKKQLAIYNPISEEQKNLRSNILANLITNHKHHIKYSNDNLFISEIGKIFKEKNYYEEESLAGLIYAPKYNKISWSNKSEEINIYQVKGILKIFFKQINANVDTNVIEIDKINHHVKDIVKNNNKIGVYNKKTKELIGIIGEINTKTKEANNIKNNTIYGFEIKLEKLIQTTNYRTHLDYNRKIYSNYPSIVRDISIPITNNKNVEIIKKQINSMQTELVESIEIFNEYNKTMEKQNTRFIGMRITYRSLYRTLDIKDINKIDENLLRIKKNIL